MKLYKLLVIAAMLLGLATETFAQEGYKTAKVYMFGFATSFNDSTLYFTDIQPVDVYREDNRTHFLVNREDYSYQLRNYIERMGRANYPMCMVLFADDEKKAMKKYVQLQKKYTKKSKVKYIINHIAATDFRFTTVGPDTQTTTVQSNGSKNIVGRKENTK